MFFDLILFISLSLCYLCYGNITIFKEQVCKFDIKLPGMSLDYLEKSKKCTVIEGKVVISHLSNSLCNTLQFPLLQEVTEYVLLAFTNCVDTSLDIFPNLMVIRGSELVQGYSLIVYNNAWKHLNFANLRVNSVGNILVSLNPFLCNVGNIDWTYLNDNFYRDNKSIDHVKKVYLKTNRFICPNTCSSSCPDSVIDGQKTKLCWSYNICQSICSRTCTSTNRYCHINDTNICCHNQCLGGCYDESPFSCVACRNFRFNNECISQCPPGYYGFKGRRCVHGSDCTSKNMYIIANQKKCVKECPPGLISSISNNTKYCDNSSTVKVTYNKQCGLLFLQSFKDLDQVEHCYSAEKIIISLPIGGRDISIKLKEVFKNLKIVKQFIQIMRSNYLESLSFLQPLIEIQGQTAIGPNNVSLDISANNALSKLWNTDKKFKILNGSVRFLANRNLCKDFIHKFISSIGLKSSAFDNELIDSTNGHIAICTFVPLELSVSLVRSRIVELNWKTQKISTSYQILSGLIYYRTISNSMTEGGQSDASCSSVIWSVIEADCQNNETGLRLKSASLWPQDIGNKYICQLLNLDPATNYQIYIEFRFTQQDSAAISNRISVFTSTEMPSKPEQVEAISISPYEIRLTWKPPTNPYGVIDKYIIWYRPIKNEFDNLFINENYCNSDLNTGFKFDSSRSTSKGSMDESLQHQSTCLSCATCKKNCNIIPQKEEELMEMTKFDSYIYSLSLKQRSPKSFVPNSTFKSKARLISSNFTTTPVNLSKFVSNFQTSKPNLTLEDKSPLNIIQLQMPVLEQKLHYFMHITNLNYFTEYHFDIVACHSQKMMGNYSEELIKRFTFLDCSNKASISFITMANTDADIIPNISDRKVLLIKSIHDGISLSWKRPKNPNGLVLFYLVRHLTTQNERWTYRCIDSKHILNKTINNFNHKMQSDGIINFDIYRLLSGIYTFQIMAVTFAGNGSWSINETFRYEAPDPDYLLKISLGSLVAIFTLLAIIISVIVFLWRKKQRYILTTNDDYFLNGQDEWNIDFQDVKLLIPIGKGNFGIVYSGLMKKLDTPAKSIIGNVTFPLKVAVKTVSKAASIEDIAQFLSEACLMKKFLGYHIVHLLGIYAGNIQKENALYPLVVMEIMENGDLSNYLHQFAEHSDKGLVDSSQCLLWAVQIADGMCYLTFKRFVHRDLAARNCLVDSNLNIKIADFGLARSTNEQYYYRVKGRAKMPVRWMAPESLKSAVFTTKTDVWSYGIVLYEISTLGALPYSGMNHQDVIDFVKDGGRLDLDDLKMPSAILEVMIWCWSYRESDRPSFMQILEFLVPYANIAFFKTVSFFHNGCFDYDQCENCSKMDLLNSDQNLIQMSATEICKHVYKCSCSNSLSVCDVCCEQTHTTKSEQILTFSVSDILKQHNDNQDI